MPQKPVQCLLKRALDVFVSACLILLTFPILLVSALCIRVQMGTPVFFRQQRPGKNGRTFRIFKFRTMREAVGADGKPLPDEDRLTGVGKIIRKLSIDELPQMFNVLKGEMSLVGPRPLLMRYMDRYTSEQTRRHEVMPGITGWAQVNGRNAISWEQKFEYDVWYVDHWSFWLDIKILWMTAWNVLFCRGISAEGQATMEEFVGNKSSGNH